MVDGAKIWSTDSNAFAKKDSLDENAKSTLAFAIQVSNAKTEDHAKIWSTTTNVFASQDLPEEIAKSTLTNAEVSNVKMEDHAKI